MKFEPNCWSNVKVLFLLIVKPKPELSVWNQWFQFHKTWNQNRTGLLQVAKSNRSICIRLSLSLSLSIEQLAKMKWSSNSNVLLVITLNLAFSHVSFIHQNANYILIKLGFSFDWFYILHPLLNLMPLNQEIQVLKNLLLTKGHESTLNSSVSQLVISRDALVSEVYFVCRSAPGQSNNSKESKECMWAWEELPTPPTSEIEHTWADLMITPIWSAFLD